MIFSSFQVNHQPKLYLVKTRLAADVTNAMTISTLALLDRTRKYLYGTTS